jgi:ankyrin repeat protein
MKNIQSFVSRLCHSPISRLAAIVLVALAWSSPAFCGEIHDAAKGGDLEKVKALLKDNSDLVNSKDDNGNTPLLWAATKGHKNVAALLLASKAEVNVSDNGGETPLFAAAAFDHKDVAELLLTNNARINAKDNRGLTPLHAAALAGHKDVAELLLANQAEVNAKDNDGQTPLHLAASEGRENVVKLLLASKAEVNAKNKNGLTPLHWAAAYGHKDIVELLLANHAEVNAKANNGLTPVHVAAAKDYKDVVELLLANHAEVNVTDNSGQTPLHWAAGQGHKEVVEMLLANHAEVNAKDNTGQTPSDWAATRGHQDVVELLGSNKVETKARNDNGATPLPVGLVLTPTSRLENIKNGDYVFSAHSLLVTDSFEDWTAPSPDSTTLVILYSMTRNGKGLQAQGFEFLDADGGELLAQSRSYYALTKNSMFIQGVFSKAQVNKGIQLVIKVENGSDFPPILLKGRGNIEEKEGDKIGAPPPNWPGYSSELTGLHEVRVKNPNDFKVRVGLRSDGKGKDFIVSPNETESVNVANGRYDIYFNYSSDPGGLYQGDSFTLENNGVEITITKVVNGNYGIRKVK